MRPALVCLFTALAVRQWYYPLARLNFNDPRVQAETLQQARLRDPEAQIDFSDHYTVQAIKQMVRLPIPALAELFTLTAYCRRRLHKLRTPLLIIQSHNDHTAKPHNADALYRLARAASPKSLHLFQSHGNPCLQAWRGSALPFL